jgi:hypothetical protein
MSIHGRFTVALRGQADEFNGRKCNILRLEGSYRLVKTVLVQNNHSRKIQNVFLTTIPASETFFL